MAKFNKTEKRWVDSFLGKNAGGGTSDPSLVGTTNEIAPTLETTSGHFAGTVGGESASDVLKSQGVLMVAPGAPTGGGAGGATGSGTGGPRERPEIWQVAPDGVLKMNKLGTPVFQSVSSQTHAQAWLDLHGQEPPVPVAFQVGKSIYVDMSRWPPNLAKPTITHPPGGPKIPVPTGHKVPVAHLPNDGSSSLGGTSAEPGGGAGKGPGGNATVPDKEVAARHLKDPSKTSYTFSPSAHEDIWQHLGNKPPAPKAFIQDGYMRVDVERWALEQSGQWSEQKLGEIGLKLKDKRLPTPHTPLPVDAQALQAFVQWAQETHKAAEEVEQKRKKGESQNDTTKMEKQVAARESEAEHFMTQLRGHPDLKGITGTKAKEFFAGVRAKFAHVSVTRGGIVGLALDLANAYELLQQIRYVLDSKSVDEAVRKAVVIGVDMVKEGIKFGAIRFVVRRTPVAVFITTFLGDLDKNTKRSASQSFDNQIVAAINKVRPDSAMGWRGDGASGMWFQDDDTKKMFLEARKQAVNALKEQMAKEMTNLGYKDGLTSSKMVTKFEVSKDDSDVLGIDDKWLEQQYKKGSGDGEKRKNEAISRARDEGLADGKNGKAENHQRLNSWYELKQILKRIEETEGDVRLDSMAAQTRFYDAYKDGYKEGQKIFKSDPSAKMEIDPQSSTQGAFTTRRLIANLVYGDGRKVDVSDKVKWSSDKPEFVSVGERYVTLSKFKGGAKMERQGVQASLHKKGSAKISAEYQGQGDGRYLQAHATITVTEPKIGITADPDDVAYATYVGPNKFMAMVGQSQRFVAGALGGDHWRPLLPTNIKWTVDPPGLISVNLLGTATMVKEGKGTITATEMTSGATAHVEVSVQPAGSVVLGRQFSVKP